MRALVTGGGGFLGLAIVRALRARGDEVVSYSRSVHPAVEALGARCFSGDLADARALREAMRGADVVFHTAAKAGIWGPAAEYERVNHGGTLNVLAAALENRVPRLVHTSSPSVCFDGKDHVDASNDLPLSTRFLAEYPRSKARAELAVLAAHGRSGLSTCALRPHLIVGPGDPHLLPRVVARARARRLVIVGSGRNSITITDVANAAYAHVQAADRLAPGARHGGKAYFVAQSEPVELWAWLAALLERLGLPRPRLRLPLPIAYAAGWACEGAWTLARRASEPPMTRFLALQLARSHTYDLAPARRDFGYEELVSLDTSTERIVADLRTVSSPERPRAKGPTDA